MDTINNPAGSDTKQTPGDSRKQTRESVIETLFGAFSNVATDLTETKYISRDFFTDNLTRIVVVVILLFAYISNRYVSSEMTSTINSLKYELKDTRYEALSRSAELVGISRPSEVKELINKYGIDIQESDKPAYKLQ